MTLCSTVFEALGHNQAKALKYPDLPILIAPCPFGALKREQVTAAARQAVATLLKMIAGALEPDAGEVKLGASLKVGYFAQQALDLLGAFHRHVVQHRLEAPAGQQRRLRPREGSAACADRSGRNDAYCRGMSAVGEP